MKKTDKRRLSLKKDYVRVLTATDLARLRGGLLSCSYPTTDCSDGCRGE